MKKQLLSAIILFGAAATSWGSGMYGPPAESLIAGTNVTIVNNGVSYVISASTGPLSAIDTNCRASTGTLQINLTAAQATIASLNVSTNSLQSQITAILPISPVTGIANGALSAGVKVSSACLSFTGMPGPTMYYRSDGTLANPISGAGDVTQAGNNAFTGNNTHSGTETFTGNVIMSSFTVSTMTITQLNVTNMTPGTFTIQATTASLALGLAVGTYNVSVTTASVSGNGDFGIFISSPYSVIGTTIPVTCKRWTNCTISTITVSCDTGTNVVVSFTWGAYQTAAATALLSGSITDTPGPWLGGSLSSPAITAGNIIYAHILSVSGNVLGLHICGHWTNP